MNDKENELLNKYFNGYWSGNHFTTLDEYELMDYDHTSRTFTECTVCYSLVKADNNKMVGHAEWHEEVKEVLQSLLRVE